MDLKTFEKLVDEHLFILNKYNLSKKGASEFRIFGKEVLYKQLGLGVERSEYLINNLNSNKMENQLEKTSNKQT